MAADNSRTVFARYFAYDVDTPAGTTDAVPQRTVIDVPDTVLDEVALTIPPGHVGLTGFAVEYSQERILPWSDPGAWVKGDGVNPTFPVGFNVDGPLTFVTFNLGRYSHRHIVRLKLRYRDIAQVTNARAPLALVI